MPPKPPVPPELAAFVQSGISVTVAVRDANLRPDGARAWAVKVHEDGTHLTVYLYAKTAPALLAKLAEHPEIALDIDAPTTHRACQLKGVLTGSRRAKASERSTAPPSSRVVNPKYVCDAGACCTVTTSRTGRSATRGQPPNQRAATSS